MPQRATSTSFKPGQSGNPGGRPKGSPTLAFAIRALVAEALADEATRASALAQFKALLTSRKSVLAALEFAAKINREIGAGIGAEIETPDGTTVRLTWPDAG